MRRALEPTLRPLPTGPRRVRGRLALVTLVTSLLAGASGCELLRGEGSGSLPDRFLGRWDDLGSGGGLTGTWHDDGASGFMVIRADGTLEIHDADGTVVRTDRFSVSRGPTVFSSDEQWMVQIGAEPPQVLLLSDDARQLSLVENVYDGVGRTYARKR